jgi:hypothetical protein
MISATYSDGRRIDRLAAGLGREQPRTGLRRASSNPRRGKSGPWAYGRGIGKQRPKGPTPRHNALRPMPVTMPRPAASQPVRSGARSRDALDRNRSRDRDIFDRGTLPDLSTPCVIGVLSTPPNHNYPADRLPGARVAASCTPLSNPV